MVASIDLSDLIPDFRAQLNVPGGTLYSTATSGEMLSQLRNAFWETVLDGLITGYVVDDDGIVTPLNVSSTVPLDREFQQIIIYYGGIRVLTNTLMNLKATLRVKAGPVEYESQQSATVLKALLDETVRRRDLWLMRYSSLGHVPPVVIDGIMARNTSIYEGDTQWLNGSMIERYPRGPFLGV